MPNKTKPINEEFEEFNPNDPFVDMFIKDSITDMFCKYHSKDKKKLLSMDESEIGVVETCIGFYPFNRTKQESLAYCVIKATMLSDSEDFKTVTEDFIMPLAIEMGVEDVIIGEILNIKNSKILKSEGENN